MILINKGYFLPIRYRLQGKSFSSGLTKKPITFLSGNPAFFTSRHHGVSILQSYLWVSVSLNLELKLLFIKLD